MLSFQLAPLAGILLAAGLGNGLLTVTGTDGADTIVVSEVGDEIVVDVDGVQTPFDADEVLEIRIEALGGDDSVTVDVNRPTSILGGPGNDVIVGSDGGADDVLGNQGADTFFGRGGADVFVWNPGDGSDVIDGGDGDDTHVFNGSGADEVMAVEPNGARVRVTRNLGNIVMDVGTFERVTIDAFGGADTVSGAAGLLPLLKQLTLVGGDGDDVLDGGDGDDLLLGGAGDDIVDGNRGVDSAFLGEGDDVFVWDPGDGSDFVEGEAGFDGMLFNGAGASEVFDASANGGRLRFTRNLGGIVMDVGTTEQIDLRALGGDDATTIHDLSGTGVSDVIVDGGAGNDSFVGSALEETFLGGEGDDTVTLGDGDVYDMGDGFDTLLFHGTLGRDEIQFDALNRLGHEEAFFHGTVGKQRAVFDDGEAVTVFTEGGDDVVKVLRRAADRWDIDVVD